MLAAPDLFALERRRIFTSSSRAIRLDGPDETLGVRPAVRRSCRDPDDLHAVITDYRCELLAELGVPVDDDVGAAAVAQVAFSRACTVKKLTPWPGSRSSASLRSCESRPSERYCRISDTRSLPRLAERVLRIIRD